MVQSNGQPQTTMLTLKGPDATVNLTFISTSGGRQLSCLTAKLYQMHASSYTRRSTRPPPGSPGGMAGHYVVHSTIQAMQTPDGARLSLDIAPIALVMTHERCSSVRGCQCRWCSGRSTYGGCDNYARWSLGPATSGMVP